MTEFGALIFALGALSLTVTKVVDFFRNVLDKNDTFPKWVWNLVALVVGLAFCLGWNINLAEAAVRLVPALEQGGVGSTLTGTAGTILTGAVVGMSAGFWHELLDALSSVAKRYNATAD